MVYTKKIYIGMVCTIFILVAVPFVLAGYPVSDTDTYSDDWGSGYAKVQGVWELDDSITNISYPWLFSSSYVHWRNNVSRIPGGGYAAPDAPVSHGYNACIDIDGAGLTIAMPEAEIR